MFAYVLLLATATIAISRNAPGEVWENSCDIIEDLMPAADIFPCVSKHKELTREIEEENEDEYVTNTAKALLNNRYSSEAIYNAGSCLSRDTDVDCRATLDTISRFGGMKCKSKNQCTFSKTSSTTVMMKTTDEYGASVDIGPFTFSKSGSSESSIEKTIEITIGLTLEPGEDITIYTFNLMKRCKFECRNVQQEVMTWQGDSNGDKISMYYIKVKGPKSVTYYEDPYGQHTHKVEEDEYYYSESASGDKVDVKEKKAKCTSAEKKKCNTSVTQVSSAAATVALLKGKDTCPAALATCIVLSGQCTSKCSKCKITCPDCGTC